MNRGFISGMAGCMSGMLMAMAARAATFTEGGYTYATNDMGQAVIVGFDTGHQGPLAIAASLGGFPVSGIDDYAFYGCAGITAITVPPGVAAIGEGAFEGCAALRALTLLQDLSSFDASFAMGSDCAALTHVVVGPGVTAIGDGAFADCSGLLEVSLPDGLAEIGAGAFFACGGLSSFTIPESVVSLGAGVFERCTGLTDIRIPDLATNVPGYAFCSCTSLTNVLIGSGAEAIGTWAFFGCELLPAITLPPVTARVRTRRAARATRATLQLPGGDIRPVPFGREKDAIQFDLPGGTAAALVEIEGI